MAAICKLLDNDVWKVDDRAFFGPNRDPGIVKFIGRTHFSEGEWFGAHLDEPLGKNDGTVRGKKYFECPMNHGIFVRRSLVLRKKDNHETVMDKGNQRDNSRNEMKKLRGSIRKKKEAVATPKELWGQSPHAKGKDSVLIKDVVGVASPSRPGRVTGRSDVVCDEEEKADTKKVQKSNAKQSAKHKGAKALSKGVREGEVAKPIDQLEEKEEGDMKSSKVKEDEGGDAKSAAVNEEEKAAALRRLRIASEERTRGGSELKEAVVKGYCLGLPATDLFAAQEVIKFEEQRALMAEVEKVRSMTSQIGNVLQLAEERAKQMESAAAASRSGGPSAVTMWIEQVVKVVEQRVWSLLEERVDERVKQTVHCAVSLLSSSPVCPCSRPPCAQEATKAHALEREEPAAIRIQAACRGRQTREEQHGRRTAAVKIQQAVRRILARQKSEANCVASAALRVGRRHRAFAAIFDASCGAGVAVLDERTFQHALHDAHPEFTSGQVSMLYRGYIRGTGLRGVDLKGFCDIMQACACGPAAAAEYADVNVELFDSLGHPDSDAAATKLQALERGRRARQDHHGRVAACRTLQRAIRKKQAHQSSDTCRIGSAALLVRQRHRALAAIFDEAVGCCGGEVLEEESFTRALRDAHSRLSSGQADALWQGYVRCTGFPGVDLHGFCDIAVACASGDEMAADFADMDVEVFVALGLPAADAATIKLQAAERGRRARRDHRDRVAACTKLQRAIRRQQARQRSGACSVGSIARLVRWRYAGWTSIFDDASSGMEYLDEKEFSRAFREVHPRLSAGQLSLLWKGYVGGTGLCGVDVCGFCDMAEACACGDRTAAEYADIDFDTFVSLGIAGADAAAIKVQAAERGRHARRDNRDRLNACTKLQRAIRRQQARQRSGARRMGSTALLVRRRYAAWTALFDEASSAREHLNEEEFSRAFHDVHPRLSSGQLRLLWKGYVDGTGLGGVDVRGFCDMAEACACGERTAAEYADIDFDTFVSLGIAGADAAAIKVQAAERGRHARRDLRDRAPM